MLHKHDDGCVTISSRGVWLPGIYDSEKAARSAIQLGDDAALAALQKRANSHADPSKRVITYGMLQQVRAARRK